MGIVGFTTAAGDTAPGPTAMQNQAIAIFVFLTGVFLQLESVHGIKCWDCQDWAPDNSNYDKSCGSAHYQGDADRVMEDDTPGYTCYTYVFNDGAREGTSRTLNHNTDYVDGDCEGFGDEKECFCSGDFCNTGLCEDC